LVLEVYRSNDVILSEAQRNRREPVVPSDEAYRL